MTIAEVMRTNPEYGGGKWALIKESRDGQHQVVHYFGQSGRSVCGKHDVKASGPIPMWTGRYCAECWQLHGEVFYGWAKQVAQ
ncbi:hypothetical protein [Deinococcus irradiatisoli]|uniref:hypothetical protein n=1 Tax=Deinococcus irradiatisoli TaxID=2202254 RepID=UPI0011B23CF5|nr:hypothetical protein [Deinococcus irradiatisoli]